MRLLGITSLCEYAVLNQERLTLSRITDKNLENYNICLIIGLFLLTRKEHFSNAVNEKYEALGSEFMEEVFEHNEQILIESTTLINKEKK